MILQNQNVGIFSIVLRQLIFSGSLKKESHMKLNKIDIKMIVEKLKIIPNMLIKIIKLAHARFKALPVERQRGIIKGGILFVSGMLVGILITLGIVKSSGGNSTNDAASAEASASATANSNAIDWSDLVSTMCAPHSSLNLLAMKMDFPFAKCMRDNGQIDSACVQQDAMRFAPSLPHPYQQSLGRVSVQVSAAEDGSQIVHYVMPLQNAAFQQLPLSALAVNIATKSTATTPIGWQTPSLAIQGDYSTIKSVLANAAPAPQTLYYANIPATSDALPGPFETLEEARIATKKAGGKVNDIKKQTISLQANFQDGLNEVVLSCVANSSK